VVLAIGNALGLTHTVTMGIISATGRNDLRSLLYENFIQTDAAINAGNSGGALINADGNLIGISTRNLGSVAGAQNIGFAIPISLARKVMEQIIEYGSVQRGWLGASFSDLRPSRLPDGSTARRGISVREVARDGPAWNAGLRQGDIILTLDGELVVDASQFLFDISQREPGSQVDLQVTRGSESYQTYATLIQQPPIE
jgi:S1-C subfamily serine protease